MVWPSSSGKTLTRQFKPDEELREPRHILQPELENEDGAYVAGAEPAVEVRMDGSVADLTLVAMPESMRRFYEGVVGQLGGQTLGTVSVRCDHVGPRPRAAVSFEEGWEGEAVETPAAGVNVCFPLVQAGKTHVVVLIPRFENQIIYNAIGKAVANVGFGSIVAIGTSALEETDEFVEVGKDCTHKSRHNSTYGVVGAAAALRLYAEARLLVVPAYGDFIGGFESVSQAVFPQLSVEIFNTKISNSHYENFLYL